MAMQMIDTLKMVRHIRDENYRKLHDKSALERLNYYGEQAGRVNARLLSSSANVVRHVK